jgi:nucleotide-binding universal stress UspA family protein
VKVLIGYDGEAGARAAVEDLVLAGLPGDVEARVLSVADLLVRIPHEDYPLASEADDRPTAKLVRTARAMAAQALREAQAASVEGVELVSTLFPGWDVRAEVATDSPRWALVKAAKEWGADLMVVGSHGMTALTRVVLGSVSQDVLGYAPCSVRIARTRERARAAPPRIVVGVDGSENAELAVAEVARRRWPDGTEVRVVTAVDPQLAMVVAYHSVCLTPPTVVGDVESAARHCAEAAVRRLSEGGMIATAVVDEVDPKRLLLEQAREWPADCVFVGAKGHRRLERFLLGSVSAAVASRAPCSVEVVRAADGLGSAW